MDHVGCWSCSAGETGCGGNVSKTAFERISDTRVAFVLVNWRSVALLSVGALDSPTADWSPNARRRFASAIWICTVACTGRRILFAG